MTDLVNGQAEELEFCNLLLYNVGDIMRKTDYVACK